MILLISKLMSGPPKKMILFQERAYLLGVIEIDEGQFL